MKTIYYLKNVMTNSEFKKLIDLENEYKKENNSWIIKIYQKMKKKLKILVIYSCKKSSFKE